MMREGEMDIFITFLHGLFFCGIMGKQMTNRESIGIWK